MAYLPAGGISPGSMPPSSRLLVEEGAAIVSFKLVRQGVFQVNQGGNGTAGKSLRICKVSYW